MAADQPNVLLVMSDEHSFRCLSHLNPDGRGEPVQTLALDDLAQNGTTFDQTYCQSPLCAPSRMCMLTGRDQRSCGGWTNGSVLRPDTETFPARLSDAGYETALVGKMHLGGSRQFGGFDHRPFGDLTGRAGHQPDPLPFEVGRDYEAKDWATAGKPRDTRLTDPGVTEIPESMLQDQRVVTETMAWIREQEAANSEQPWFVCSSLGRPHDPWTIPRRYLERYWPEGTPLPKIGLDGDAMDHPLTQRVIEDLRSKGRGQYVADLDDEIVRKTRACYFGCVDYMNDLVGDLLAQLERDGSLENTVVIYTSDHGELAGEHGLWYKRTWHEASTRVPFILQLPGHRSGDIPATRLETPVSLADLYPTICGLTGTDAPDDLDGIDLTPAIKNGEEPDRGPVVCDNMNPVYGDDVAYRMVRDGQYKYVGFRDAPELLFDLEADPHEQHNLAPDAVGEDADALERLRSHVAETMDFEALDEVRAEDEVLQTEYALENATVSLGEESYDGRKGEVTNVYHMPDGRLVDADSPLYNPIEVAHSAKDVFDDYEGER